MKALAVIALAAALSQSALAEVKEETWVCIESGTYDWNKILVTAKAQYDISRGTIEVASTTRSTHFQIDGFNRRWNFDLKEKGYDFSFYIQPDGDGYLINFKGKTTAEASQYFDCKKQ